MKKASIFAILVALSGTAFGQKVTLRSFIAKQYPNQTIAFLEGDKLKSDLGSLDGFNRKSVTHGKLNAIVPISMVKIDDSFTQKPDIYEGMEMRIKVHYLLASLNDEQIKLATSKGIGLGDVNRQQALILNSIIPKKFHVERLEQGQDFAQVAEQYFLTKDQRDGVRLKITRSVGFMLKFVADERTSTSGDSMDHLGTQNMSGLSRVEENMQSGPDEMFGVTVRSIVPNTPKPADLDYKSEALSKSISFAKPLTIQAALNEVRKLTNVNIYADPRVAERELTVLGKEVRISDLLMSIAEMVTGTYRRVGSDFVLTSDLMGLGTRKLRFDVWESDLRYQIEKEAEGLEQTIGKSRLFEYVKSASQDRIQPSAKLARYIAGMGDGSVDLTKPIPDDVIDPSIHEYITKFNKMYSSQAVSTKGLGLFSQLRFNFTLGDGKDVMEPMGGSLSSYDMYRRTKYTPPNMTAPKLNRVLTTKKPVDISLKLDTLKEVVPILTKVHSIGFSEVWIETESAEVLKAAIEFGKAKGLGIRLVMRPWKSTSTNSEPDYNLLGLTASELVPWAKANPRLSPPYDPNGRNSGMSVPLPSVSPRDLPDRWNSLKAMLRIPGLAGGIIHDPMVSGYDTLASEERTVRSFPALTDFGYSLSMRSAFLRKFSVDPIDLVPPGMMCWVNVNPMFFPDMELMGMPRTYGRTDGPEYIIEPYRENWRKFRTDIMSEGLKRFNDDVLKSTTVPLHCDMMVSRSSQGTRSLTYLAPFDPAVGFVPDERTNDAPMGKQYANRSTIRVVVDPDNPGETDWSMTLISNYEHIPWKDRLCYDMTKLKSDEITKFLDKWFDPRK